MVLTAVKVATPPTAVLVPPIKVADPLLGSGSPMLKVTVWLNEATVLFSASSITTSTLVVVSVVGEPVVAVSVVLPVRTSEWRTWSSKTLLPEWTGEWMVEVLSKDGTPLENLIFFVQ